VSLRALAAVLVLTVALEEARAQDSCTVHPSERALVDCATVDSFAPDQLDVLVPNNTLHLIGRAVTQAAFRLGPQDHYRQVSGLGALVGIAPLSSQALRISLGADAMFGRWAADHGAFTLEPHFRVAFLNRESLLFGKFIPSDLFLGVLFPTTFGDGAVVDYGAELGVSWRPFSLVEIALAAQAIYLPEGFVPDEARTPGKYLDRIELSAGMDFAAFAGWTKKTPPHQTHADLRCPFFERAVEIWHKSRTPGGRPAYCGDVDEALKHLNDVPREHDPLRAFWGGLHASALGELAAESVRFDRCVEQNRREQRGCIDCRDPARTLRVWFAFTLDPYQVAAAVGCQTGVNPEELRCDPGEPALEEPGLLDRCR